MKIIITFLLGLLLSSCEVCRDCERTYYDVNGVPVETVNEEICGTNNEVKREEGVQFMNGVKTVVKCK